MRRHSGTAKLGILAAAIALASSAAWAGAGANLGFEAGSLQGWTGTGDVVEHYVDTFTSPPTTFYAPSGQYMLMVTGGCPTNSVSQTMTLRGGRTISGVVLFQGADAMPFDDSAAITVTSEGRDPVTVYQKSLHDVGNYGLAPFKKWSFTAPADADYTLTFSSTNGGDCSFGSKLLIDAVITNLHCASIALGPGMSCTLTDVATGAGLGNETINLAWGGPLAGTAAAVTNATGVATDLLPTDLVGAIAAGQFTAEFNGSAAGNGSAGSAGLV